MRLTGPDCIRLRTAGAILIALTVAGCASRPGPGVLRPINYSAPGTKLVTVYVATTRERAASGENGFTSGRSSALNLMKYTISIPPIHKQLEIEWPQNGAVNPAESFAIVNQDNLTENDFKIAVQSSPTGSKAKREAFMFVHGYNYNFQEFLYRMAQLVADGGGDVSPILFAWPSEGTVTGYVADKEAVTYSRDSLAHVLTIVAEMRGVGEIGLVGHSMGAWLIAEALRQLRLSGKDRVIERLHHVALAAPDIDVNVFRSQMAVIGQLNPPMKLLVSKDDQALSISARLADSTGRVGNLDVADPTVEALAAAQNIEIIDVSNIPATGYMNHDRFIGYSAMLHQIPHNDRRVGVADPVERAGTFVLNSAGAIVTSPLKIIRDVLPN